MKNQEMKGNLYLLLTAFIWGSAFVAQSVGMDYVGPFTFQCSRSILATIFLVPVFLLLDQKRSRSGENPPAPTGSKKTLWTGGILCGILMTIAANLQQVGMQYTSAGKAGFITATYIVLVPIFGLFLKKKVPGRIWLCVLIALAGLYLLSVTDGFSSISKGDFVIMLCAVAFSFHIMVVDHFSPMVDGVRMSCIQFLVTGILSGVLMFLFEKPTWSAIYSAALPIAYAGILSSGVAYTLQIVAQKYTKPTIASLLMSLESVFAVLTGAVVLHEIPTNREGLGCLLMFAAIIISQLPEKHAKAAEETA